MRFFSHLNLREQLLLVALVAILPIMAVILSNDVQQRQAILADTKIEAERMTTLSSTELGQMVEGARQMLVSLARLDAVHQPELPACSDLLHKLLMEFSQYRNLAVASKDGQVICSAIDLGQSVSFGDQAFFKQVLITHDFTVSSLQLSPITRLPAVIFAYPVTDDSGLIQAVLMVSINPSYFISSRLQQTVDIGGVLLLVDGNGIVVARYPDGYFGVGKDIRSTELGKTILAKHNGQITSASLDGTNQIYAFQAVDGAKDNLFVSIGIPYTVVTDEANQALYRNLLIVCLAGLLAITAVWFFSNQIILKPLYALQNATMRLANGDLSARAVHNGPVELQQLAGAFDVMAETLEENTNHLKEAEANFRALVERIPAITYRIVYHNDVAQTVYISPQVTQILGYQPEEWIARADFWWMIVHPDDLERVKATWAQFLSGDVGWHIVYRALAKDGRTIWFRDDGVNVEMEGSSERVFQGVMLDITDRETLQAAMRDEHDLLRKVMENSPIGITLYGIDGSVKLTNPIADQFVIRSGLDPATYTSQNFRGRAESHLFGKINPQDSPFVKIVQSGRPVYDVETKIVNPDTGESFYLLINQAPILDASNQVTGIVVMAQDITQRKQFEVEKEEQQAEYRAIFHTVPALIIYFDSKNRIIRANRAAGQVLGTDDEDLVGRRLEEVFPNQADEMLAKNAQVIASGRPSLGEEMVYSRADGETGWAMVDRLPYQEEGGKTLGVIVFMNDISERRHRERELEALVSIAGALRNRITQAEMWPVILEQVATLASAEGVLFARRDESTHEMVVDYGRGKWAECRGIRFPSDIGVTAVTLDNGQPYLNNDSYSDPMLVRENFIKNLKAVACLPLTSHDQVMGVIWIGKKTSISEDDFHVLIAITDIAANAIYRAALYDQTQLRLKRLAGLHSIDMAITSSLEQRLILDLLLDQVTTQLQADGADILLFHADSSRLEYSGGKGRSGNNPKRPAVRMGDGIVGRIPIDRDTIQLPDLTAFQDAGVKALVNNLIEPLGAYFAAPLIAKGQVKGVLEVFKSEPFTPDGEWLRFVETLATQTAIAIDNAELFDSLQITNNELKLAYDATIEGWSRALDQRDHETQGHSERVTALTMELARRIGIPKDQLDSIRRGVLLHDIGKMAIPDAILLKPDKLTDEEWTIMRNHPVYAYNLLSPIPYLRASLDIPYAHHEHWDGSGYPRGLAGEAIPLAARMFSVVDVWDALTSDRPYREAWSEERVKDYILSLSGIQFDPKIVEVFMQLMNDPDVSHLAGKTHSDLESG